MTEHIVVTTDTASVCVFDPKNLQHRITDSVTWWTDRKEALKEINAGNALFVKLGGDGEYAFNVRLGKEKPKDAKISAILHCPSGRVYFGASEWTTSDGQEPSEER